MRPSSSSGIQPDRRQSPGALHRRASEGNSRCPPVLCDASPVGSSGEKPSVRAGAGTSDQPGKGSDPGRSVELVIREGVFVHGDPHLLQVVMENLIANAWKFTGKNPQARTEFGMTEQDGANCCYIRDNGVGFDMAYSNKLFGAFQRLHRQDEFPGTGVGLATVQRIINRHGGRIWAEGRPGEGATFFFVLPTPT